MAAIQGARSLEPDYKEKALTAAEEGGGAMRGVFHAVKRNESRAAAVRVPDHPPLGELLNGRVVEVLVKEPDHAWCVAIHPNEAGLKLLNRYRLGQTRYARRGCAAGQRHTLVVAHRPAQRCPQSHEGEFKPVDYQPVV